MNGRICIREGEAENRGRRLPGERPGPYNKGWRRADYRRGTAPSPGRQLGNDGKTRAVVVAFCAPSIGFDRKQSDRHTFQ